ncbi:FAD-dependent oxidoreductase [Fodinicola feengrottensis]|uniref:FAD-dependent oxidoreductase n=1 Tax=Fodinicola feengrottensis TaxID=435914 RepID=UPI002442B2D0|nr:FAD-dependent monooxygenase [Fodinicola feengrottensis]
MVLNHSTAGMDYFATTHDDYINIAMWTSADRFAANVGKLRGAEVIELALEMTPHWHPHLRRLFELGDPASSFPVVTATSVPVDPWPTTNVTLLGDAIHTMTPGHGVGANTALRDAALLCRCLVGSDGSLLDAIGAYEAEMIPYGFARVRDSLNNNGTSGNDPLYRPFAGRLAMAGARTYFRAVDKIPSVRRKFVDDLTTYRES